MLLTGALLGLLARPALAQAQATRTAGRQEAAGPHPLARWLDMQALVAGLRYRYVADAHDRVRQNQLQTREQLQARFKFDAGGRYGMHAGLTTGNAFRSGWNPTGLGTGEGTASLALKQLFVAADPATGVGLQYGSLYPARGEATEITTYDNDGYLAGARATIRRPTQLFFDEVTATGGYLGYLNDASVFHRTGSLSRFNYWQAMVSKRIGSTFAFSTDYSEIDDDGRLRQAARWKVETPLVDALRGEYGIRLRGGSHETAFAVSGEKGVRRMTLEVGYANVDPAFGDLNGDRYGAGNRIFSSGSVPLPFDLTASWFVQKEISPPATSSNDVRVDAIVMWNVLKTLRRAGALP